ncbi:MAG: glycine cleavage system protein H [Anaeromyxobacteraceae bacterium]
MTALLTSLGVFLSGIAARVGIVVLMAAVLAIPAILFALVRRGLQRSHERKLGLASVAGVRFRPGVAYAPGHTWLAARKGGALELGVDDIAQRLLPSVTSVEVPRAGTKVERGDVIATLSGGGREIQIRTPVPAFVVGVNAAVVRDPALVKRDGYGKGWLVALRPADASWSALPQGPTAEGWLKRESARWSRFLEDQLGFAAADGGELLAPEPWLMGEDGWRKLVQSFLTV